MELSVAGASAYAGTGGRAYDPARPSLMFIHGAGMDHSVWALQSRYFAHHGYGVLAVDLPGHGRSGGAPLASIGAMADWALALIAAVEAGPAVLVGHSMGALIALEAARRVPDRVRALGLLGAAPAMPVNDTLLQAAEANDASAIDMVCGWAHGASAHRGGGAIPSAWLVGGGTRLLERAAPGVLHKDLAACNDYGDGPAAAGEITCPTLILSGTEDVMVRPKVSRQFADLLANAEVVELPGTGHMLMTEASDATLVALRRFLEALD